MAILHEKVFTEFGCEELDCIDFYRELFRYSDAYIKYGMKMEIPVTLSEENGGTWRSCALADLDQYLDRSDVYLSACTYFPHKLKSGKWASSNSKKTANQLCAFVLDLDRGNADILWVYLTNIWVEANPLKPTYVVCSGNGLHLYYVLDQPVKLLKRWWEELQAINNYLYSVYTEATYNNMRFAFFNEGEEEPIDSLGELDRHGITQPYRMVSSLAKNGSDHTSAWKIGNPCTIKQLAEAAGLEQTVFDEESFDMRRSFKTRRWEEYANKQKTSQGERKGWNPGFYAWLVKREREHSRLYGEYGHRYKQVQALTVAAIKDRIPNERLEADVRELCSLWNDCAKKYGHPEIAWGECVKAMDSFNYCVTGYKFPKWWLEELCGWEFGTQKRNGRSRWEHLHADTWEWDTKKGKQKGINLCKYNRELNLTGRPTKEQQIKTYAAEHPEANHSQIARALSVSRSTVVKWLKKAEGEVS